MLHEFLTTHRGELIERARAKVATRVAPRPTAAELKNGVPLFLEQLVSALLAATQSNENIRPSATLHGGDLLRQGFTIAQVVHDYGDVCQAVTELASELSAPISNDEFHTLNRCLDDAIAEAVTEYSRIRTCLQTSAETERLGFLAHELRNRLSAGMLAFATLKTGRVGVGGSTGAVVERSLRGLRDLIDSSLTEVRIDGGLQHSERIVVAELLEEIELDAWLEANERGIQLTVGAVEPGLAIEADRPIVTAAMLNVLQNALKFSRAKGHVTVTTTTTADRVRFEIEDECGGLAEGQTETMFAPFTQQSADRSGLGLGLTIARRGLQANGGDVRVRNLPGKGCVFTLEMPRAASPA